MDKTALFPVVAAAIALPAVAYLAWFTRPATLISASIGLTIFSGNWGQFGLPELVAPDRILLAAGILGLLLRAPPARDRPAIHLQPIHWLLGATIVFIVASAIWTGAIHEKSAMLRLVDRVGVVGFVLFALAPVAYTTRRDRDVLLAVLVGVGLYLGVTAFFEVAGVTALIVPVYIANESLGIHFGRARGPFLEAVGNGTCLYFCAVAAAIAWSTWRQTRWRRLAALTTGVCGAALLLTLTRSVWVGAIVATAVTVLVIRDLRRFIVPGVAVAGVVTIVLLATIPDLRHEFESRRADQSTVWDRYNLNRAAFNMVEARPLVGFGWDSFKDVGTNYFELGPNYPLTAGVGFSVHSAVFAHLAELGLIGTTLWLLSWILGPASSILRRGPPALDAWKAGLLAIAVFWFVVANFVYPYTFSVLALWTWAGIATGPALRSRFAE